MARRMVVRESMAQGPAELANDNAVQISRCFSALRNRRRVFKRIADPGFRLNVGSPQTGIPTIQSPHCMPERRRIVAQVRREVLKNRGFFGAENKAA
jgi:hypothetical protein